MARFLIIFLFSALLLGATSCAPQPSPEQDEASSTTKSTSPAREGEESSLLPYSSDAGGRVDESAPDWERRYQELYQLHYDQFTSPSPGQTLTLELKTGQEVTGVLDRSTDTEIFLEVEDGVVAYSIHSLSPRTAARLLAPAYAKEHAKAQGRREVRAWQKRQQAPATPTPLPRRPVQVTADSGSGVFSSAPVNKGPDGRVWQVEQYIRENAALPHSLRIKAWGKVQPYESGYKVRVQYTLDSAGGLGTSSEDMMFFMNRSGRVYRRAPVK